jgi:hypothetical protein
LFTVTGILLWGLRPKSFAENPQVTVSVYNDAQVSPDILSRAQQRATEIFSHSGLNVTWTGCIPADKNQDAGACTGGETPNRLVLRIIPRGASSTTAAAFGVAFLAADGTGRYSDVFWRRAQELHATSNVNVAAILGSVMAHEVGHLLLGSNAHAVSGIMRAQWQAAELRHINMGTLLFLPGEGSRMRARAAAGSAHHPNEIQLRSTSASQSRWPSSN